MGSPGNFRVPFVKTALLRTPMARRVVLHNRCLTLFLLVVSSITMTPCVVSPVTVTPYASQDKSCIDENVYTLNTSTPVTTCGTSSPVTLKNLSEESRFGYLHLETANITHCLRMNSTLYFFASNGSVDFHFNSSNTNYDYNYTLNDTDVLDVSGRRCKFVVTVPPEKRAEVKGHVWPDCEAGTLFVYDSLDDLHLLTGTPCNGRIPKVIVTLKNIVVFYITIGLTGSVDVVFTFQAVTTPTVPHLELQFTSDTQGYIKTPRRHGESSVPELTDSWAQLTVPPGHAIMVSTVVELDLEGDQPACNYDIAWLYKGGYQKSNLVWKTCGLYPMSAAVHLTDVLYLHFVCDKEQCATFRLLFSFHDVSALPQRVDDNLWNCSVPWWHDFQEHLLCNWRPECFDGKDELACSYEAPVSTCSSEGFAQMGRDGCFALLTPKQPISWNDASTLCLLRGARLASLSTLKKWNDVTRFLVTYGVDTRIYIGLKTAAPTSSHLYKWAWQWTDSYIAYNVNLTSQPMTRPACAHVSPDLTNQTRSFKLVSTRCDIAMSARILCELEAPPLPNIGIHPVSASENHSPSFNISFVVCPSGHVTQTFLACDVRSACWAQDHDVCLAPLTMSLPPAFPCTKGNERVPYTLLCDHRPDCSDGSDETFCEYPACKISMPLQCGNRQCVKQEERCDGLQQCVNGADEDQCSMEAVETVNTLPPPVVINLDGRGRFSVLRLRSEDPNESSIVPTCPETHFLCPGSNYCLPVYVRCNGMYDCPNREDEADCGRYSCPGFYRCRASSVCVHASHVCDGVFQCLQHDDELLCSTTCPEQCRCQGRAFTCIHSFPASDFPELRYVDARGSGMSPADFKINIFMIYLNLAHCDLTDLNELHLPNLRRLDVSDNRLTVVKGDHFRNLANLQELSLARNPLTSVFLNYGSELQSFPSLQVLDFSSVYMQELNVSTFTIFPNLQTFNLCDSGVERILHPGFQLLKELRKIDVRGCSMKEFPRSMFKGLTKLEIVLADTFKLCCPATLPEGFILPNCHAPPDEISSCDDLLRSNIYRIFLSIAAILALLGNFGTFLYRVVVNRNGSNLGFSIFVTHLSASDFLMGLYLATIGVADLLYRGKYVWEDTTWKNSTLCHVAGFFSLLSNEVSALVICFITLDRFLVLHFPFSRLHFRKNSAQLACLMTWVVGLALASVPLMPMTSHWQFYSQTGICVPLPISRDNSDGALYSFGVMIVLNFALFILVATGQIFIYWSIRTNSMQAKYATRTSKDLTIARRLITVVVLDFFCWFPIGLIGFLASTGTPIPSEVNVALAIFVLPFKSALNPFLYTLNMILERRRHHREQRRQKFIFSQMQMKEANSVANKLKTSYTQAEALGIVNMFVNSGLLSREQVTCQMTVDAIAPDCV